MVAGGGGGAEAVPRGESVGTVGVGSHHTGPALKYVKTRMSNHVGMDRISGQIIRLLVVSGRYSDMTAQ